MSFSDKVSEILSRTHHLLIENYFELQRVAENKYGKNTLIFMEIGSFYEIYESDKDGKASEISKILNILLTKKNKKITTISETNPYLCGIPTVSLEKHLQKLALENKWTILLISQEGKPPKITRYLNKIISPGTNIDYIDNEDKNYIASIYLEVNKKDIYSAGLTLLDPTLGEILIYENYGKSNDKEIIIDEINQIINTYNISEIIYTSSEKNKIKTDVPIVFKEPENIFISYQEELIKHSFGLKTEYLSAIEGIDMEMMPFALNSLTILLDFVIEHNKLLGVSLQKPKSIYSSKYMYLGNNPISQLDIYNKDSIDLLDIINKGITSIGRRFIKEQIFNPLKDKNEIEDRYIKSSEFINYPEREDIEESLKGIYDIERILRKLEIGTIQPFEFSNLHISLSLIKNIEEIRDIDDKVFDQMLIELREKFDFEIMSMSNLTNITRTFIKKGVSSKLDNIQKELSLIEKNKKFNLHESFLLKESENEGLYLEITNKKYDELKDELNKYTIENIKSLKNSKKIFLLELSELSDKRIILISKLIKETKKIFYEEVKKINTNLIRDKIEFISYIDFYINNAKLFENKAYSIPKIVDTEENFYEVDGLRHPIVESIENEIFIPNNIQFGLKKDMDLDTDICFNSDKVKGYLLYGQNSSGKTVLSKSIGLSIIMAQSGFFVPANELKLSIFNSLFTRISGNDNLLRGLSTFAVEMLELKNILNRANNRSMVIGDEISHGTETVSGLSIVASTILNLKEKNSSFIIATHLHQLDSIYEIDEAKEISPIHLSLTYDENKDLLKYNRKIQKGKGSSIYGLEFAKSLKLPKDFLSKAYQIRKELADDLSGLEELTKKRKSKYNSSVYIGVCSECGGKAEEIHHINEQQEADKNGMIGHIRKNNKANLKPLCKKCHLKQH